MKANWRRITVIPFVFALVLATGCGEDLTETGPQIDAISITPSTIATSQTGMTDEFFSVDVTISGFTEPIDLESSRVFYVDATGDEVTATAMMKTISGANGEPPTCPDTCTISFDRIFTNWFQEAAASETPYDIGAEVVSVPGDTGRPSEVSEEVGLADVTVTDG